MALPIQFPQLTRQEKKRLLQAAGVVGGVTVLTWWLGRSKPKPKKIDYGLKVNPLCSEFVITDQSKLERTFDEQFEQFMDNGVSDPWTITAGFLAKVAPQCRRPAKEDSPVQMRNPGETLLYFNTFVDVAFSLEANNVMSETARIAAITQAKAWAIQHGVSPDNPVINDPALYGTEGAPEQPTCPEGKNLQLIEQNGELVPVCV